MQNLRTRKEVLPLNSQKFIELREENVAEEHVRSFWSNSLILVTNEGAAEVLPSLLPY
jgi:hypothetical protein